LKNILLLGYKNLFMALDDKKRPRVMICNACSYLLVKSRVGRCVVHNMYYPYLCVYYGVFFLTDQSNPKKSFNTTTGDSHLEGRRSSSPLYPDMFTLFLDVYSQCVYGH